MNINDQPTLNCIGIWTAPQTVPFNLLAATIADADAVGFEPVRIDTDRKRGEYVVTYQQMTEAQAATVDRIVGNARLAACKPADALKTADEANDATAGSVDTAALDIGGPTHQPI